MEERSVRGAALDRPFDARAMSVVQPGGKVDADREPADARDRDALLAEIARRAAAADGAGSRAVIWQVEFPLHDMLALAPTVVVQVEFPVQSTLQEFTQVPAQLV